MKTKLLSMVLLAGGALFGQTRFSVGIGVGGYGPGYYAPPPPAYAVVAPCPGPDYYWVNGYWSQRAWRPGYWARRHYAGGYGRLGFTRGFEAGRYRSNHWDRGRDHGYGFRHR